jgi:hypothetical protein
MGEERKVYKVLVGEPKGKRPLGRPRRRWEYGIIMDLRETSWGSVDWIQLAEDRDRWRALGWVAAIGGLLVRVLAIGSKIRGFTTGGGRRIFKGDENRRHDILLRGINAIGPISQDFAAC